MKKELIVNNASNNHNQYIYTLANGNKKCSIMSAVETIRTILIQSIGEEYYSKLKNTDFAKFDRDLCYLASSDFNYDGVIDTDKVDKKYKHTIYSSKFNYKKNNANNNERFNTTDDYKTVSEKEFKMYDLTLDRTGKSNVEGGRINWIDELLIWNDNDKWNKNISDVDKANRDKVIHILRQAKDSNMNYNITDAVTIIINIFPELKQYIGNVLYYENNDNISYRNKDVMSTQAEEFATELDEYIKNPRYNEQYKTKKKHNNDKKPLKSFLTNKNPFFIKNNLKEPFGLSEEPILKRSESSLLVNKSNDTNNVLKRNKSALFMKYKLNNTIFNRYNFRMPNGNVDFIDNSLRINTNTPYLLFQVIGKQINDIIDGYDFIAVYDKNGQLNIYELVGMQLANRKHGVSFSKKGNANNSWCGVDSNRNANDNNYTLEDIIYNEELGDNNTYLAKVYADKEQHDEGDINNTDNSENKNNIRNNNDNNTKHNSKKKKVKSKIINSDGPYLLQLVLFKKLSEKELVK